MLGPVDRAAEVARSCPYGDGSGLSEAAGVALLEPELGVQDDLSSAVRGFLALCLADTGREREALALALGALAPTLPRYQRSLAAYAEDLVR